MKRFLLLTITTALFLAGLTKADTNHFGAGGVFELDLGDLCPIVMEWGR